MQADPATLGYPVSTDETLNPKLESLQADPATLGYPVSTDEVTGERLIEGPDGYKYMVVDTDEGDAKEPFLFVSVNLKNPKPRIPLWKP